MSLNLIDSLDNGIIKHAKKERARHQPKKYHYISDHSFEIDGKYEGVCLRRQAYDWMGIEPIWEDIQPKRKYAPYMGNRMADALIELWKLDGWKITAHEWEIGPFHIKGLKYPVKGRLDVVLQKDNQTVMVELKTTHGGKFKNRKYGIKYVGPMPTNVNQLAWYKKYYNNDCDYYHLLYFSREDFNRLEFRDNIEINLNNEFNLKYWQILEDCLEKKKLPPRDYRINADYGKEKAMEKFPCGDGYCDYKRLCWEIHSD